MVNALLATSDIQFPTEPVLLLLILLSLKATHSVNFGKEEFVSLVLIEPISILMENAHQ